MPGVQVNQEQDSFSCENLADAIQAESDIVKPSNSTESDNDSDDDNDDGPSETGPSSADQKRRAQNKIMRAFAATISAHVTQQEIDETTSTSKADEQLSIKDILAKQDTALRIKSPRSYQTELFLKAKEENIIAVLDTGSGKTHIATLLLQHILYEELARRARGQIHKMAFFIVDSVNLVFQQANVLSCGLDQKVEGISGASGASLWTKSTWEKLFTDNMVIVCTAEVLHQCMMHSFITMSRISLLIFDEAHHAKNNHPYARIMRDYYESTPELNRPRIFGMTASPVDVKGLSSNHIREAASDLETLLYARIATISEIALASTFTRPAEQVVVYATLPNEFETSFHKELKTQYGDVETFQKFFQGSKRYSSELGSWASDIYWSFAFADEQSRKLNNREQMKHNKQTTANSVKEWDKKLQRLEEAAKTVQQHDFGLPILPDQDTDGNVSSKVRELHKWLMPYYERGSEARCIVFVEKRQTARLLNLIFSHIGGPNLHCDMLVGLNNNASEGSVSLRKQIMTVAKFRRGELNCLFTTSVAEEGLDIPKCNLVVRFDLYRTMIGYIQSRGRARHKNSKFLHMIEHGNHEHHERLIDVRADENAMRQFCTDLPQDRKINDIDDSEASLLEENIFPSYTDPISGAKLTYRSSFSILNHFVSTWPYPNRGTLPNPYYVVTPHVSDSGRGFRCEVILPEGSPIISAVGEVKSRKIIARCAAAFKMCLALREKWHLDQNLLPTAKKVLPLKRNAQLALNDKKGVYEMMVKPTFWKVGRNLHPDHLYFTAIDVDAALDRPHQPLGFLTRSPLPQIPTFPIYLPDHRSCNIVSRQFQMSFPVTQKLAELLTKFTLQIYKDMYNKTYECNVQKVSYWIVPLIHKRLSRFTPESESSLEQILDMEQITRVCHEPKLRWTSATKTEELLNKYFVDPFHGGRRYYSKRLAPHLKPLDPVPPFIPRQGHNMNSILDYSDSKFKKSRDVSKWDSSQPVLEVEKISFRRNHLAPIDDKEKKELNHSMVYICPEPLEISNLALPFVVMCYVLPAIVHRFESYLIAVEASESLGLNVNPALALEALTKDSDNSDEHEEEKINFKSGMGPNYERLEFLGDCFLKMATSLSVFVQQPDENEFEFHVRRMMMLCNQNLMETAIGKKVEKNDPHVDDPTRDLQLYKYVRTEAFSRRTWYPEGIKLESGKGFKKGEDDWLKLTHRLGDKSIADVCEAFIGAALMDHQRSGPWSPTYWNEAVKAVKLFVNSKDHLMSQWSDYYAAYEKPKYQVAESTAAMLDMAHQIEKQHPYHFNYPRLLRSAFTHPSYPFMFENVPNYQRLEFLGDSLLDMAFINHLFYKYPDKDPHWLTEHKTPMVSNKFLGAACVKLGWHKHIKQNTSILSTQIREYVQEIEEAEREAGGAVDYWVGVSEPPKCLADVIEAFVAALFVDAAFDFNVVQHFFELHLKPFFADMTLDSYENFSVKHPVTRLGRLLSVSFGCSDWRIGALETETLIPGKGKAIAAMITIHDKVRFHSLGTSGRYAKLRACSEALDKMDGLAPFEFRERFGCDCVDGGLGEGEGEETKLQRMKDALGPNM